MSKKSPKIGRLFRRKRTDGTFVDGWFFRVRRGDVEVTRKGGATKKEAQSELERVVEDLDRQLELVRQGLEAISGNQFQDAENFFRGALLLAPGDPQAHYQLARLDLLTRHYPDTDFTSIGAPFSTQEDT